MKKHKILIIIGTILAIVTIPLCVLSIVYYSVLPFGCDAITVVTTCGAVRDGEFVRTNDNAYHDLVYNYVELYGANNSISVCYTYYRDLYKFASDIKNVKLSNTDDVLSEVQIMQVDYQNGEKVIDTVTFAYDFYLKKVYCQMDNTWYLVEINKETEELFDYLEEHLLSYQMWRGQSISSSYWHYENEDKKLDLENAYFRYDLYWSCFYEWMEEAWDRYDFRDSGFVNTDESEINNREDAVAMAGKEMGFSNPNGFAYFDETCGYWLVEVYDDRGEYAVIPKEELQMLLYDISYVVVIDDSGRTIEIYKSGMHSLAPYIFE